MLRRFSFFLVGVLISSTFIYFSAIKDSGNRYTMWTWKERVKESLRLDSVMFEAPAFNCLMDCNGVSREDLDQLLNTGSVEIAEAAGEKDTLLYYIEDIAKDGEKVKASFEWIRSSESGKLVAIKKGKTPAENCECP